MIKERRQKPRSKVREICYIQIDPDNGGVVLDISEGGLSFQAAAPVLEPGAVHFGFVSRRKGRVDADGQIAWKSADKKVGGLRFTRMTPAASEWVYELLGAGPAHKAEPEFQDVCVAAGLANAEPRERLSLRSQVPWHQPGIELDPAAPDPQTAFWLPPTDAFVEEQNAARRQGFLRGLGVGFAVTALIAALLLAVLSSSQPRATSAQAPGGLAAGAPSGEAATATRGETPLPPVGNSSSTLDSASADRANEAPHDQSQTSSSQAPATPTSTIALIASSRKTEVAQADAQRYEENGQEDLNTAYKILRSGDKRNLGTAAQWLWAAVKNGNTQAEVELSDLYLTGEGVARNCEQARILLRAAADGGNAEARERLQTLSGGCSG